MTFDRPIFLLLLGLLPVFWWGMRKVPGASSASRIWQSSRLSGTVAAPVPGCLDAAQAQLQSNEKTAGKEKLKLQWKKVANPTRTISSLYE